MALSAAESEWWKARRGEVCCACCMLRVARCVLTIGLSDDMRGDKGMWSRSEAVTAGGCRT